MRLFGFTLGRIALCPQTYVAYGMNIIFDNNLNHNIIMILV